MKIGPRYDKTVKVRPPNGGLSGATVTRWYRAINGNQYRFTHIKWDEGGWGVLSRNLTASIANDNRVHFIESEDLS